MKIRKWNGKMKLYDGTTIMCQWCHGMQNYTNNANSSLEAEICSSLSLFECKKIYMEYIVICENFEIHTDVI